MNIMIVMMQAIQIDLVDLGSKDIGNNGIIVTAENIDNTANAGQIYSKIIFYSPISFI